MAQLSYHLPDGRAVHPRDKANGNPILQAMFHYNHIYKKHSDRYIRDYGLPLKRFLYYLRGILVCKWLSQKATMPPVRFKELVDATVEEPDMKAKIAHLLELKKRSNEHNLEPVDEQLFAWAQEWAEFYNQKVEQLDFS